MASLWWRGLREGSPGKRALSWRGWAARSMVLVLAAFTVMASLAQQTSSSSSDPVGFTQRTASVQQAPPVSAATIPKKGILPGELRQQADRRFLARRGILLESRRGPPIDASSPTISPATRLGVARRQQQALLRRSGIANPAIATPGAWQALGPTQVTTAAYGAVTGRITSLAADPNSGGNTLYVGATGGGVWKSTNAAGNAAGVTFAPLTDELPAFSNTLGSLSIGAITVQPTSPSVVLAGTGDPNNALDSYYGVGILRSVDGGNTWALIGGSRDALQGGLQNYNFTGNGFAGFAWSSINSSLVVAAVAQSLEAVLVNAGSTQNMEAGLYYSTDAGQTWYLGVIEDDSTHVVQSPNIVGSPPGNSVTSVVWNPVRKRFYAAVQFHGYYESTDGVTWMRLASQPGSSLARTVCPTNPGGLGQRSCPIFRGVLAAQPVTGDLFALTTDLNNLDQGLFRDVCSTTGLPVTSCASSTVAFGTQIASGALENGNGDTTIALADYNLTLAAVASQQDTVLFAGTEDIYRCSLANSCAWRNTTNIQTCASAEVAPSQHATEATFGGNGVLYFANDGGLWRSTDTVGQTGSVCASTDASHYQNLNSGIGSLAEVEHFAVSPGSPTTLLAGLGSFGTVATTSGSGDWQQLLTGEGSYAAIDPANPQNWYSEAGSGVDIFRCINGASCNAAGFGSTPVVSSASVLGDADYFDDPAPWTLDPLSSASILLGTCRVWRGPAAGGWSSADLLSPMLDGNQQAFCNGNAQLRSVAGGYNTGGPSGTEQMYAGMAGPYDGGGTVPGHVFTSTVPGSGGLTTWTDLYTSPVTNSSNNPQFNQGGFAVSSIAVDPHDATGKTVYVTMQGFSGNGISEGEVYGSTDAGAHWLNLTNSLPLAPANSIVVDPNVPSILYVALDTGVYYTQNVAACSDPTQNCWAVYGSGLPNAPVTSLQLYSLGASSILEASTYGRGIWSLGLLTAPAQGTLSPANYTFPNEPLGVASPSTSFTLTNTGSSPLVITGITVPAEFGQNNNCGSSLASASNCTIQVTFTPIDAGDHTGLLTVYANVSGGRLSSTLDGTGLAPASLTVTPPSLSFPGTVIGATSSPLSVTLQNGGGVALSLGTLAVTTDYLISSNSCGSTLGPGASCTVGMVFAPSATGDRAGHLSIPSGLPSSPTLVPLDGAGLSPPALTLAPTSLLFPSTGLGAVSASQGITVTNTGGATAQLQAPTVSGDYQVSSDSCGATLAPLATCVIQIVFAPAALGVRAGLMTLSANIAGGQVTALLSGTAVPGAALTLTPALLVFPLTTQGLTASPQSIRLMSSGGVSAQLGAFSVVGDYAISANTCGATLAVGASCTLQVTFTPTAIGDRPGLLTVATPNAQSAQLTALLDGTGVSLPLLSLNPTLLTFSATALGATSPSQSIAVTNLGGTIAQLLLPAITGDFAISGNNCGSALAPGANCTLQISFTPTAIGTRTGQLTLGGSNFQISFPLVRRGGPSSGRTGVSPDSAGGPATATFSGNGVAVPVVTYTPSPAVFDPIAQGTASAPKNITVANTGSVAVTLQPPTITGDYQISSNTCGTSLGPGSNCIVSVIFHPTAMGGRSGTLVFTGTMSGGSVTDYLSGTGESPGVLVLTPGTVNYPSLLVGSTSPSTGITVQNTGGTALALPSATITGDYQIVSNSCGATLAAGGSCGMQVAFHPTAAGARPGQLQQGDGIQGDPPQVVTLNGTGLNPGSVAFTPASVSFGQQIEGTSSATTTMTATNSGGVTVHLQTPMASPADFVISNNSCGVNLGPGNSCTLLLTFKPTAVGARNGMLTLASDAGNSPASASLNGTGLAPGSATLNPNPLNFPSTVVGSSTTNTATVTNNGAVTVQLGAQAVTAGFAIQSTTCTGTLAAGNTCSMLVAFRPTRPGNQSGTLSLPGQFAGSPATAALSGLAVAPGGLTLSPASVTFTPAVVLGTSSPAQAVTVTNSGGVAVQMGLPGVSGDYGIQANSCPASLAPGASCTLQIVFTPTAAGDRQGLLTVSGNIAGSQVTAVLDGTGALPGAVSLSASILSFGPVPEGSSSASQTLTVSNGGGTVISLQAPVFSSAEYQLASSTCASSLGVNASCALGIVFHPTAAGDQPATVTISANGGAIQAHAALDGSGVTAANLVFSPTSLVFGSVLQNNKSAAQTATLTNSGGVTAVLSLPVISGDYAIASNNCGATLAGSASCTVQVTFNPTTFGSRPGMLTVSTSNSSSTAVVALSGTGTLPPSLVLTPTALTFPTIVQGTTSAAQNITVANTGAVGTPALNLQPFSITGDFAISADTCSGTPLAPTYSCSLSITFTPTAAGVRTGLLTVSDGAEMHTATLNGIGLSAPTDTLSTGSLTFGPQVFGTVSAAQSVTVSNTGGATLNSISVVATGPFIPANNCGTMLGGGLSCSIAVKFAPTDTGVQTGQLTVKDALRTQTVALSGSGVLPPQAVATPASIDFGSYAVGATTAAQSVTMTNNGKTPLTNFTAVAGTANFAVATNGCGATIPAGTSCTLGITFTPSQVGNTVDQLTLSSPSLSGPLTVALAGAGEDFQLSVTGSSSVLITNGQTATYHLVVTPVGSSTGTLTFACAGNPTNSSCNMDPVTLPIGGNATGAVTVTILTGLTSSAAQRTAGLNLMEQSLTWRTGAALALLLPCLLLRGRQRRTFLVGLVAVALVLAPAACGVHASGGSSRVIGAPPGGGTTPPGQYSIVVTGSFPGAQRTATLTLTVE